MTERLSPIFRILHWGIALIVILNAFILVEGDAPHQYLGYACLGLVILRLLLGKKRSVSHYNPKAHLVYGAVWTCIAALTFTGFLMGTDPFWGNSTLEETHELISNLLLFLVAIHLTGIFIDAYRHRRPSWMVMISGKKHGN